MTTHVATDLLVLGSGPAGCATAIASKAHGLDVVVVDRFTGEKQAVGEHLSPDGVIALKTLGLAALIDSPDHAPCPFIESVWGGPDLAIRDYMTSAHGSGVNLNRTRFDAELRAQMVACGARLFNMSHPAKVSQDDIGWTVALGGGAGGVLVHTRFLVDATGRAAWLGRRFGSKILRFDQLVAIVAFLTSQPMVNANNGRLLIEPTAAGWWYSVNLPSGTTIATWMTEADSVREDGALPDRSWRKHLASAPYTAARCAGLVTAAPIRVTSANTQCLDSPVGDDWLATGDAAQAYDPLSSAGISNGLNQGLLAANTVVAHLRGDVKALQLYAHRLARDFTDYLETRHAYYAMEQRWSDAPFWQRRHSRAS